MQPKNNVPKRLTRAFFSNETNTSVKFLPSTPYIVTELTLRQIKTIDGRARILTEP